MSQHLDTWIWEWNWCSVRWMLESSTPYKIFKSSTWDMWVFFFTCFGFFEDFSRHVLFRLYIHLRWNAASLKQVTCVCVKIYLMRRSDSQVRKHAIFFSKDKPRRVKTTHEVFLLTLREQQQIVEQQNPPPQKKKKKNLRMNCWTKSIKNMKWKITIMRLDLPHEQFLKLRP